ncbi:hypothetical protein J2810_002531 [Chryseobacterium rhizosphaerae]|uniref:PoNi-like cognate immunity protein n=1 Tax=Chryseobacterium rhizosphaerae TaxID=395937 RepID=UPI0028590AF9|nr:PoNe immunity protein domain-containing protein [Chryseobacterium rhizosphaerae]MDR6546472.1 hypothetical protein [Chryseobacterium rhizosphaerae]
MNTRDKLNSKENFMEIIARQNEYIEEELEDLSGYGSEDTEEISETYKNLSKYSLDNMVAAYSAGEAISKIEEEYIRTLEYFTQNWEQSNSYVQMVWMLSIGIMLNIEQKDFFKLVECVKNDNPNDYLVDFLIGSRVENWSIHKNFKFSKPYKALTEVIDLAKSNKDEALKHLVSYLQKDWYKGHSDTGWYDAHKSKWNIHTGYWSFESGALVKILGLDDSSLKEQQYYPYDLVHWKD